MTSCCENNLLLNQKDALERLANTIENMPENDFILFPITKIDDVKKVRVILRKSKDQTGLFTKRVGLCFATSLLKPTFSWSNGD